jgi:hypothetical protein
VVLPNELPPLPERKPDIKPQATPPIDRNSFNFTLPAPKESSVWSRLPAL